MITYKINKEKESDKKLGSILTELIERIQKM